MKTSKVLRIAKKFVGTSFHDSFRQGKEKFICCAISGAAEEGRIPRRDSERVQDIVEKRLSGHTTLEGWLASKGIIPVTDQDRTRIQQHRHAWLDMMIAEFEAKGD